MINDVLIAGAGPNGLMLACELGLAGVRSVVLERLPEPSAEPKANGLVGQVVPMLDRRGLYEVMSGVPGPPQPTPGYMFGGMPLNLTALDDNPMYLLPVPQVRITRVLAERATELGAEIRYAHELAALSQDGEAVTATIEGPEGPYRLRARYLVGADGGHSVTRKLSGIGFPGVTKDDSVTRSAHARPPAEWVDPATGDLTVPGYGVVPGRLYHRNDRGVFVCALLPGREPLITTVEWGGPEPGDTPMTLDEMRESIRRVLGTDVPLDPPAGEGPHVLRRLAGGNTRLAERYRDGRVLLAGDAAHVHSAMGGPGLNLGLQDVINLGWRLAAQVRGDAAPGLLDGYEAERRPVARRVIMHTQAQAALIAPGGDVTALRELFAELLRHPHTVQHLADLLASADIRYDLGDGAHPLAGGWARDMELRTQSGTVRLAELTRTARPLLLDMTEDASPSDTLRKHEDRIDIVTASSPAPEPGATALLIRPDSYVAWASSSSRPDDAERETLRRAVEGWFR